MSDEKEQGDPNKEAMIEPGEGDASAMLPSVGGYEDSEDKPSDTETETVEVEPTETDTETETEQEDNPDLALLREHELDATYKTVPAALAGVAEKNRYIEQQRRDNELLRATLQQAYESRQQQVETPQANAEDVAELLATNPEAALRKLGYVNREQIAPLVNQIQTVQDRLEHQAYVSAVGQFDDLKDVAETLRVGRTPQPGESRLWDTMWELYHSSPSLRTASSTDLVPLLYSAAKQQLSSAAVSKVPDSKKRGATTASASRGARRPSGSVPDFDGMTEQQLYDWHKEQGLLS